MKKGSKVNKNVYYIGDGSSDAIAMNFVHNNSGKAIFVYQPNDDDDYNNYNNQIYNTLNKDGIIDFYCIADYTERSMLSNILNRKF